MPSLVEIDPVVPEKKIFNFVIYIFTLLLLSPLEKGHDPSFEKKKLESPSPKNGLYQV